MKKPIFAENLTLPRPLTFTAGEDQALALAYASTMPATVDQADHGEFLDHFLNAIKAIFLYVPGVAFMHIIIMGLSLMIFYGGNLEMAAGTVGAVVISAFLIMMGIGKLSELKYLRVVGGVFASSVIAGVAYAISASIFPGNFFGTFFWCTLPLSLILGFLVKRNTDELVEASA